MKALSQCTKEELKTAIWHLNNGREPGGGPYAYTADEVRQVLYERFGEILGYHEAEYVYANSDKTCDCSKCEKSIDCIYPTETSRDCPYYQRFQRLPREKGGLGLCPKLKEKTK